MKGAVNASSSVTPCSLAHAVKAPRRLSLLATNRLLEATSGFEPLMRVLQTLALPLGDVATLRVENLDWQQSASTQISAETLDLRTWTSAQITPRKAGVSAGRIPREVRQRQSSWAF